MAAAASDGPADACRRRRVPPAWRDGRRRPWRAAHVSPRRVRRQAAQCLFRRCNSIQPPLAAGCWLLAAGCWPLAYEPPRVHRQPSSPAAAGARRRGVDQPGRAGGTLGTRPASRPRPAPAVRSPERQAGRVEGTRTRQRSRRPRAAGRALCAVGVQPNLGAKKKGLGGNQCSSSLGVKAVHR